MDEPKVIGLAGVGLQVPDVAVAEKFYGAFGLAPEKRGAALGFRSVARTAGNPDEILVLPGSAQKRMHHISFTIRHGDEDAFQEKLRKSGLAVGSAPDGAPRSGLWFQDPWGTWINLFPGISPYQAESKRTEVAQDAGARVDVARWRELKSRSTSCANRPPASVHTRL